jgi:hypothetical protein
MHFKPLRCPRCNKLPRGTLETVTGIAELVISDGGGADYSGQTDIDWNGQETVRDDQGMVTLIGECDHQWQAEMVDLEPE